MCGAKSVVVKCPEPLKFMARNECKIRIPDMLGADLMENFLTMGRARY